MRTIIGAVSITLAAAFATLSAAPAGAAAEEDVHSARFMLPYCKLGPRQTMANTRNALIYGQCFGMISGIVTVTEVLRQARRAGKADIDPAACVEIPGDTSVLQLIDHVVKYGERHPEQLRERLELVAFAAFHDAWPCGN